MRSVSSGTEVQSLFGAQPGARPRAPLTETLMLVLPALPEKSSGDRMYHSEDSRVSCSWRAHGDPAQRPAWVEV